MRAVLRASAAPALAVCTAGAALPAATLALVGRSEAHLGNGLHFWGVGATAVQTFLSSLAPLVIGTAIDRGVIGRDPRWLGAMVVAYGGIAAGQRNRAEARILSVQAVFERR